MYLLRSPKRSHTLSLLETASEAPNCRAMTSCSENQISVSHSEFQSSIGCYDFSDEKISHIDMSHSEDHRESSQSRIHQNNNSGILRNRRYEGTLPNEKLGGDKGLEEQSRYYFASNTSNNAGSEGEPEQEQNRFENRKITHRRQNQGQIGISNFLSHPQSAYFEESISSASNDKDLLNQNLNNIENNNSFSMMKTHNENNQNYKDSGDIVTATAVDERISSNEVDDICTDSPSSSSSSGNKQDEFIVKVPEVKLDKFELDKKALLQSMEGLLKNYQNTSKESLKIQNSQQQSLGKANNLQIEQLNEIKMLKKKLLLKTEQLQSLYDWKKKAQLKLKKYKKEERIRDAENCTSQRTENKIGKINGSSQFLSDRKIYQGISEEFKKIGCCEQCDEAKLKRLELEEEIINVYHDQFQIQQDFEEIIQGKDEVIANLQIQVEKLGNDLEIKREQLNKLLNEINENNSNKARQAHKNSDVNRIDKCQDQDKYPHVEQNVVMELLAEQLIICEQLLECQRNERKKNDVKDIHDSQGIQQEQTSIQVQFIEQLLLNNEKIKEIIENADFSLKLVEGQLQSGVAQISEQHQNSLELNVCLQQKLNELQNALDQQKQADAEIIASRDKTIETLKLEQQELFARIKKTTDKNTQIQLICQQKSDEVAFLQTALEEKSIENNRFVLKIEESNQKGLVDDSIRKSEFEEGLRRVKKEELIKEQRLNIQIQQLGQLNEKYQLDIESLKKEIERLNEVLGKRISQNEEMRKEEELEIAKLRKENQTLERINGDLKAQIIELQKNEAQKRQETLEMQDTWVKEKQLYQQQIQGLEEQVKKYFELLNDAKETKRMQLTENQQLKQEIAQIKQEQAVNESNFVSFKEQTAQNIKTLEEKIIKLGEENNSLKETNQKMILESKQLGLFAQAVKQRETQLQAANDLLNFQQEKISNLLAQIREQDARVQTLVKTNENSKVLILQAEIKVNGLESQVLDLKKKLEIKDQLNKQDSIEGNEMYLFKQGILDQLLENRSILARSIFENISYCMREIHDFIQAKPTKFLVNAYQHIFKSLQQQADRFNSSKFVNSNGVISWEDPSKIYPNIEHSSFDLCSKLDISAVYQDIHEHFASMLQTVLSLYSEINRQVIQTNN